MTIPATLTITGMAAHLTTLLMLVLLLDPASGGKSAENMSAAASISSAASVSVKDRDSPGSHLSRESNRVHSHADLDYLDDEDTNPEGEGASTGFFLEEGQENYWKEVKAIIGGVLGFWGGVGGLGTLFLVIVLSQRYCCRKNDEEKDGDG